MSDDDATGGRPRLDTAADARDDIDLELRAVGRRSDPIAIGIRVVDGRLRYSTTVPEPDGPEVWPDDRPLSRAERALLQDRIANLDLRDPPPEDLAGRPPRFLVAWSTGVEHGYPWLDNPSVQTRWPDGRRFGWDWNNPRPVDLHPVEDALSAMLPNTVMARTFERRMVAWFGDADPGESPLPAVAVGTELPPPEAARAGLRTLTGPRIQLELGVPGLAAIVWVEIEGPRLEARLRFSGDDAVFVVDRRWIEPLVFDLITERWAALQQVSPSTVTQRVHAQNPTDATQQISVVVTDRKSKAPRPIKWELDFDHWPPIDLTEGDRRMHAFLDAVALAFPVRTLL